MLRHCGTVVPSVPLALVIGLSAQPETLIGRDVKACHLMLDSTDVPRMISRKHAVIKRTGTAAAGAFAYAIDDCKTLNGLFVNDVKVATAPLRDGDVITFGNGHGIAYGQRAKHARKNEPNPSEFVYRFTTTDYAARFEGQTTPLRTDADVPVVRGASVVAGGTTVATAASVAGATAHAAAPEFSLSLTPAVMNGRGAVGAAAVAPAVSATAASSLKRKAPAEGAAAAAPAAAAAANGPAAKRARTGAGSAASASTVELRSASSSGDALEPASAAPAVGSRASRMAKAALAAAVADAAGAAAVVSRALSLTGPHVDAKHSAATMAVTPSGASTSDTSDTALAPPPAAADRQDSGRDFFEIEAARGAGAAAAAAAADNEPPATVKTESDAGSESGGGSLEAEAQRERDARDAAERERERAARAERDRVAAREQALLRAKEEDDKRKAAAARTSAAARQRELHELKLKRERDAAAAAAAAAEAEVKAKADAEAEAEAKRAAAAEAKEAEAAAAAAAARASAAATAAAAASSGGDESPGLMVGKRARRRAGVSPPSGATAAAAARPAAASARGGRPAPPARVSSFAAAAALGADVDVDDVRDLLPPARSGSGDSLGAAKAPKRRRAGAGGELCIVGCGERFFADEMEAHVTECLERAERRHRDDAKLAAALAGGGAGADAGGRDAAAPAARPPPLIATVAASAAAAASAGAAAAAAGVGSSRSSAAAAAVPAPAAASAASAALSSVPAGVRAKLAELTKPVPSLFGGARPASASASASAAAAAGAAARPVAVKVDDDDDDGDALSVIAREHKGAAAAAAAPPSAARPAAAAASSSSAAAAAAGPAKGECPLCSLSFAVGKELEAHCAACTGPLADCPFCHKQMEPLKLHAHVKACEVSGAAGATCTICSRRVPKDELKTHTVRCKEQRELLSLDERMAIGEQRQEVDEKLCNAMQLAACNHVAELSKPLSERARKSLATRFAKLRLTVEHLDKTLRYIRHEAPLIIHFNVDKVMRFFVKDTHYRNQFETAMSGGTLCSSTRTGWEDRLFGELYHSAKAFDRCKYGVLNIVNDPRGVRACNGYGDSFLVLKNDRCRLRTTFASEDTSSSAVKLATCEHYAHVLAEYTDEELVGVVKVACKDEVVVDSAMIRNYKEVQFHGPLEFAKDFEAVCIHHRHKSDAPMMKLCNQFADANGITLIEMDPE